MGDIGKTQVNDKSGQYLKCVTNLCTMTPLNQV